MYGYVSSMWQMQDSCECMAMNVANGYVSSMWQMQDLSECMAMSQVCGKCRIRVNVWLCLKYVANVGFV